MIYAVRNLDKRQTLYFQAKTSYEAMKKLKYYLALSDGSAERATINITKSARFLYLIHKGDTYSVKM